jgi:hypothetical protein
MQANRRVAGGWKSVDMAGYRPEAYGDEISEVYDDSR